MDDCVTRVCGLATAETPVQDLHRTSLPACLGAARKLATSARPQQQEGAGEQL